MVDRDVLRFLSTAHPDRPVVSIYAHTDPRDPGNSSQSPAWAVEVRNGLRDVGAALEADGSREDALAWRELHPRVEQRLEQLDPAERGRSFAYFTTLDGSWSELHTLRLPVRETSVVLDERPFVSPLVDVVDRGSRTGVILVALDHVRLVEVQQGEASDVESGVYDLELGDWRHFGGSMGGHPGRGTHVSSHMESYEARVDKQRDRLYRKAASAVTVKAQALGWEQLLLVAEDQVAGRFEDELPAETRDRLAATIHRNLGDHDAHEVAVEIEGPLNELWDAYAHKVAADALEGARAGGRGSVGPKETLWALAEGRVAHLVLDPHATFEVSGEMLPEAVAAPAELLAERAVETAIASGAEVTALAASDSEALAEAGGMAALLRY